MADLFVEKKKNSFINVLKITPLVVGVFSLFFIGAYLGYTTNSTLNYNSNSFAASTTPTATIQMSGKSMSDRTIDVNKGDVLGFDGVASVSGASIELVQIYVKKVGSTSTFSTCQSPRVATWCNIVENRNVTGTSAHASGTWIPQETGQFYVSVITFVSIDTPCSGDPVYNYASQSRWVRCDNTKKTYDFLTINVNNPPTPTPTEAPTPTPTQAPTSTPTPTQVPTTVAPTKAPTQNPTQAPTKAPTQNPTRQSTPVPTTQTPTSTPAPTVPTETVVPPTPTTDVNGETYTPYVLQISVVDKNNKPIQNAIVSISQIDGQLSTDNKGIVTINNLMPGVVTAKITYNNEVHSQNISLFGDKHVIYQGFKFTQSQNSSVSIWIILLIIIFLGLLGFVVVRFVMFYRSRVSGGSSSSNTGSGTEDVIPNEFSQQFTQPVETPDQIAPPQVVNEPVYPYPAEVPIASSTGKYEPVETSPSDVYEPGS